ncbi:vacuolar protein sorting-associated protein 8 homolog [Acipenser ruthenus]|uniref:vacuolar protein sorting-associated protein 8 homolog n=1 Tax=Acipenser ruthenus TaxID=7906 RepID=UPI00156089F3|nr:vacuolar protein sorting-associated protein 8 homolog [Acipenser ruthenus]
MKDLLVQDNGMMDSIEACIVHLDIQQVVQMCWEHHLHDAMIYVYNSASDFQKCPVTVSMREFQHERIRRGARTHSLTCDCLSSPISSNSQKLLQVISLLLRAGKSLSDF